MKRKGRKTIENVEILIKIPVTKIIGKTAIWTIFSFLGLFQIYIANAIILCTMTGLVE